MGYQRTTDCSRRRCIGDEFRAYFSDPRQFYPLVTAFGQRSVSTAQNLKATVVNAEPRRQHAVAPAALPGVTSLVLQVQVLVNTETKAFFVIVAEPVLGYEIHPRAPAVPRLL
jgi:hypothetical protein